MFEGREAASLSMNLQQTPHRRLNPLTREWVLVSPHRTLRPWQGQVEEAPVKAPPRYDVACYLCPGNERAGGKRNPHYEATFVFDNDFPALLPSAEQGSGLREGLIEAQPERGVCRVLCFSPRHDLTLSGMAAAEIRLVVDAWVEQFVELGGVDWIQSVQIFENRGAMMGASNPHPHGQIWANESLPNEVVKEQASQEEYFRANGCTLLADYLQHEQLSRERLVCGNEHFAALVPFWALWPFETLIVPVRPVPSIDHLSCAERDGLADILKRMTTRYDNLFQTSFPYSFGIHQAPTDGNAHPEWHLHGHFYPPLLRSAAVKKFMVGYEMFGTPQRDLTAETAAQRLRETPEAHGG
jgi:UDPglucose--hexose-1-phosphate uridylyltransferase